MNENECDMICTKIENDAIDLDDALDAHERALIDDPTESLHAAHIRDAIRHNFEYDPS